MLTAREMVIADKFIANFPREDECDLCFGVIDVDNPRRCFKTPFQLCRNRIFLSFRFTGEDYNELDEFLTKTSRALADKGNAVFCSLWLETLFRQKKMSADEVYEFCINQLAQYDIFLAFIRREEESKGMLLELDEAVKRGKKIVLFIKKGLQGHKEFRLQSNEIYEYHNDDDLIRQLQLV